MLSYRHSYHAGNFADVIKHCVLIEILKHFVKKEAAFDYIDTHAGAGLYDLNSEHAQKLQEYKLGFGKLTLKEFPELEDYFEIVSNINKSPKKKLYPGSPKIAESFLRRQDRSWLFEMHPTDYVSLKKHNEKNRRVRVNQSDGFKGALALLPPQSRRALILIDPSYEIKSDYHAVADNIISAHKKFSTGIYALWYPVVDRERITTLEKTLVASGIKNIQQFELGISKDHHDAGMTASGMIVVNPPWTLLKTMESLLPKLARTLGDTQNSFYTSRVLVQE